MTLFSDKMLISHTWFDAQLDQKILDGLYSQAPLLLYERLGRMLGRSENQGGQAVKMWLA